MRSGKFRWKSFAVALAASLLFHIFYIVPHVIAPLVMKNEAPVEIAYVPDLTGADEPPKPDEPKKEKPILDDPVAEDVPKPKPQKPVEAPKEPAPEVAKVEPPKPEPEKPPPPPAKVEKKMHMVDQEKFPDEADNQDAHFLAQKNHRAAEETRAKNTNMIREVDSPHEASSELNDNKDKNQIGGKEQKVAELENHKGDPKTLPRSSPLTGQEGTSVEPQKPGPLSMRDLTPKSSVTPVEGQKAHEGPELQEDGSGNMAMARIGRDAVRGHAAQKGAKYNLQLDHHNYDNIEGYGTAEHERNEAARAESSHKKGRYDKYLAKVAAMRSSIENYVPPEVKVGNQTELGTRASPFAAYITKMHRQIHRLFGDGFLAEIEGKSGKTPYDDYTLWTKVEIVLKPDGVVDKVTIVRTSGVMAFDVAAIDSVMSAAPFPKSPPEIRSANGNVYLHWEFHRDDSACTTANVQPFILTTPGQTPKDVAGATEATDDKAMWEKAREQSGRGGEHREAPRTLAREKSPAPSVTRTETTTQVVVPEVTAEVRTAAEGWFASYTRGDAAWLAGWSATPFTAAGEVIAKDAAKLKTVFAQLLAEAPSARAVTDVEVFTPAGIRGRLGGLPPGGEENNMLFAVGKVGKEELILLLKKSNLGWRVCGLDR